MDIEKIEISRFGCLHDLRIDDLGPGVHVFHGTNETGKTTLLEFVRGMLFGFASLVRRDVIDADVVHAGRIFVRPVPDGRVCSALRRRAAGTPLTGKNSHDELVVEDDAGRQHIRTSLEEWTGGLDESSYVSVMAFGLDELHELSSLQSAGCGGRLYELAGGLDRGHVVRVLEGLRNALGRADSTDPTLSPIVAVEKRLAAIRERIATASGAALKRGKQIDDVRHLQSEIAFLEPQLAAATAEEERLLTAMEIEPLMRERAQAHEALRLIDPENLVHPDFRRWRRLDRRRRREQRRLDARRDARRRTAVELRQLPKPSAVWKKRRLIRPLLDDEPRLERLTAEAARAETAALLAARRFGEELGSLGLSRLVEDEEAASHRGSLLPAGFGSAFRSLRTHATACREASRAVREAATELELVTHESSNVGARPSADRAEASQQRAMKLEQAAAVETLIRKRLTAGERLEDVQRSLERIAADVRRQLEGQVLPSGVLTTLGTAFSVGIGLLFSGLLLPTEVTGSMAYAMTAVGLAGAGIAGGATWSLDRSAASRVTAARNQLATAERQRKSAEEAIADLDARLQTDSHEPLNARLIAVREEIASLEAEAKQAAVHADPSQRLADAEQQFATARRGLHRARGRWRRALEARGFPPSLTPRTFRELTRHRRHLEMLEDERRHAVEDARGTREDLTTVSLPIEQAVTGLDLAVEGLAPLDQLALLRERLAADTSLMRRRRRLRRLFLSARNGHRVSLRRTAAINRRIAELLRRWDVETEEAFLMQADRRQAYDATVARVDKAEQAVEEARRLIPLESLTLIDGWLSEADERPLDRRARDVSQNRDRLQSALHQLRERLAGLKALCDATRHDRALEPLQMEEAEVAEELAFHCRRRAALKTALELLTETRRRFLEEHQPPVLLEASMWLEKLTGGRYRHISAVADDAVLMIDDADGVHWSPERLSRGTREQVFLALRLALVADLERAGIRLPLIMDDALVNFDDERAQLAAETLVSFCGEQGRQMLVLSCHAHVVELFRKAGAHIRGLDGRWLSAARRSPATPQTSAATQPEPQVERDALPPGAEPPREQTATLSAAAPPDTPRPPSLALGGGGAMAGPGDGIPEIPIELVSRRRMPPPQPVVAKPQSAIQLDRPIKTLLIARHTWSAEEFAGELDDRVAVTDGGAQTVRSLFATEVHSG
jgi:uncharacterized protein YhaN